MQLSVLLAEAMLSRRHTLLNGEYYVNIDAFQGVLFAITRGDVIWHVGHILPLLYNVSLVSMEIRCVGTCRYETCDDC